MLKREKGAVTFLALATATKVRLIGSRVSEGQEVTLKQKPFNCILKKSSTTTTLASCHKPSGVPLTKKPPIPSGGSRGHRQGLKSRRFLTSQSSGCHSPTCQRTEAMRSESWELWVVLPSNTQSTAPFGDGHQLGFGAPMVKRVKPAASPVVQHWIR